MNAFDECEKMEKLLSIVIPVYNCIDYIERCLLSLDRQNFPENEVEIIIVNDGSSDGSDKIINRYASSHPNCLVIHKNNGGVASARNFGLRKASGRFLAWIDSDDYVSDDWYEKISVILKNKDCDAVLYNYFKISSLECFKFVYKDNSGFIDKNNIINDLYEDKVLHSYMWMFVIKREAYIEEFSENLCIWEDLAVFYKVLCRCSNFYYVNKPMYYYWQRVNSLSHNSGVADDLDNVIYDLVKYRYDYLKERGFKIAKWPYLEYYIYYLKLYWRQTPKIRAEYRDKYNDIENEVKSNILEIVFSDLDFNSKKNAVSAYFGLLKVYYLFKYRNG